MKKDQEKEIIANTLLEIYRQTGRRFVPAAISNRHMHLSRGDIDALFGVGYELTPIKPLSQPGQFAAKETVTLIGPKGKIDNIRVLGPARNETQVEISVSDSFVVGIKPVVRMSGDLPGSPEGELRTERGSVQLQSGVMVAARHLHLSASQAKAMELRDGQNVSLKTGGERSIILENVIVRCGEAHEMEVHLDTDEANGALLKNGGIVEVLAG